MIIELGYGRGSMPLDVPDKNLLKVLTPAGAPQGLRGEAEVKRALREPIGTGRLRDIVRPGEKIALVSSDITRPMPTWKCMPAILEELRAAGVSMADVSLTFGLGSHRAQTDEEKRHLAGDEAWEAITCRDSDPGDCVHFGTTSRGTDVDIDRVVARADRRILLGNIEYHYFAGYSGGGKALMPGVSTPAAIQQNHSFMVDPQSRTGHLEGNPVRADIEEAAAMVGADFIVNVVLDEHKEIVAAVAGDMILAHRAGCRILDKMYSVPVPKRADIVVTCQGGAPKDVNLYQVQKAIDNAKHAVRDGGTVIVVGACTEGLGNGVFASWMEGEPSPAAVIERLRQGFRLGGHKAAAICQVMQRARMVLVSEMAPELVHSIFMEPAASAQEALDRALELYGPDSTVTVMPFGGSTLPRA